jgi:TP901 family phage tail tape measure protein
MMGLDAGSVVAHLKLNATQFNTALKSAQQQMQSFSQRLTRMGSYLTLRATLPLVVFGRQATKSFAQFNDAIIRAAAVTRGMNNEMRKEMEKTAIQLSKKSLFSATELAEGYFALGQAGYDAAQEMKVLPIVERFATAATIDLDTSIRYLARTAEGLGMAMQDPIDMMESMTSVSDAFTFAAITTTAEIRDFAVAMTHAAAPALKLVNKSMEEGVSVLMAFARAGIVAEEAGTLLWTTVRDLQRANIRFRAEWKRLGIDVYDAYGMMRNMADIFADLEAKFANMSDEAKKASLQMLGFQDRSLRGIQALMGFSSEMKIFQNAMGRMGNLTERVAETYKKSFNAQLIMAKHNIQAVTISIGWMLSPFIIKVNEQIKRFASWWESLSSATKILTMEIGIFAAMLGPLLLIFGKMVFLLSYAVVGFKAFAIVLGGAVTKALGVVLALCSGWLATVLLVAAAAYTLRAAWSQGVQIIKDRLVDLGDSFKYTFDYLKEVFGPFVVWLVESFREALVLILSDWDDFSADLVATFTSTWQWLKGVATDAVDVWNDPWITWSQAADKMRKSFRKANDEWAGSFVASRDKAVGAIDLFKARVMSGYTTTLLYLEAYGEATKEHLVTLGQALKTQFGEDVAYVTDLISDKVEMMNKGLLDLLPGEDMMEIVVAMDKAVAKMRDMVNIKVPIGTWEKFLDNATKTTERFTDVAIRAFESTAEALSELSIEGSADFKALAKSIMADLNLMIIRMMMAKAIMAYFPAWAGGQGAGAIAQEGAPTGYLVGKGSAAPVTYVPHALGAAFNASKMIRMQAGGVIDQATFFAMDNNKTGLMGEAGPEAIMPLSRTASGELGVKAEQPNILVEPKLKINNIFDPSEIVGAMDSAEGEKVIINILRRKGLM